MTCYPDLNSLKRRRTDMGDNTTEIPLSNPSLTHVLDAATSVAAYFRDLERPLLHHIAEADAVVGCVAWLSNLRVLSALASLPAVSIVVQKEDFLRPDTDPSAPDWKSVLQAHYDAISPIRAPYHLEDGWIEIREPEYQPGTGLPLDSVGFRCIGHKRIDNSTMPRMHHKFLVFLHKRKESGPDVEEGAWPYQPYAVWTGSYNITNNGNLSLENAVFIQNERLAEAYCNEWAQLIEVSEALDWTSEYATPEIDHNTGIIIS